MEEIIKNAIEEYQCPGCVCGSDIECFQPGDSLACSKHCAGTIVSYIGSIFLGMPKGFCRLGLDSKLQINIYTTIKSSEFPYNKWNVPVWKYLNKTGHTFARGISPRINQTFLHIFLEDCRDSIDCLEITQDDINKMD